jgi:hypothetical protein
MLNAVERCQMQAVQPDRHQLCELENCLAKKIALVLLVYIYMTSGHVALFMSIFGPIKQYRLAAEILDWMPDSYCFKHIMCS